MSGVDSGLWGAMLSAMSVVVGFQLFFIQNWLSGCLALEAEAERALESPPLPDARLDLAKKLAGHKASYPTAITLMMSLTVVIFSALSVVVGVQLEGIPAIFTVSPGVILLTACLSVTVVSWRQAAKTINCYICKLEDKPRRPQRT